MGCNYLCEQERWCYMQSKPSEVGLQNRRHAGTLKWTVPVKTMAENGLVLQAGSITLGNSLQPSP